MALAQKRVPYAFQRPANRAKAVYPGPPSSLKPIIVPTRARVALHSLTISLAIGAAAVAVAVLYVGGYARMTGVNYRKVRIQQAANALLTQQQLLHSEILRRTERGTVAAWAQSHAMVLAGSTSVVIGGSSGSRAARSTGTEERFADAERPIGAGG